MKSKKSTLGSLLGENIAERRKELGLTQADLAERLGTDAVTVSRFERGSNLPSLLRCEQLAEVLDSSLVELFAASSTLQNDQVMYLQKLLTGVSDENRIFLIEMVKAWVGHINKQ